MKCSKCGAQCSDNRRFCPKCGNDLRSKATYQDPEVEEELANSVGALMDEFSDDDDDDVDDFRIELDQSFFEEDSEAKKVRDKMQLNSIYTRKSRQTQMEDETEDEAEEKEDDEDNWEYDEDQFFEDLENARKRTGEQETEVSRSEERRKSPRNSQKSQKSGNKKKLMITLVTVVVLLAGFISFGLFLFNNVHFHLTTFDDYYRVAYHEFKRDKYRSSLKDAQSALRKAELAVQKAGDNEEKKKEANAQIVKVRELINDIYEESKKIDDEYVENMRVIVDLDESKTEYFVKIAKYLKKYKQPKELTDFLRTVDDDNLAAVKSLKDYIVKTPKADKDAGQYTGQFAVTLTGDKDCTIWYTTDGSDPSIYGTQYTEPVKITKFRTVDDTNIENGVTELKVVARNAGNVESKIKTYEYEVVLASAEPQVTPDSGQYHEYTQIKVIVPEGSKCYYTISEGSAKPADPDTSSAQYYESVTDLPAGISQEEIDNFKPLEIPRGTHIMKFILIDEYGIKSDVAVRSYTLEVPRNVTLDEAEDLVQQQLVTDQLAIDEDGNTQDGHKVTAEWEEIVTLDKDEYFIVAAVERAPAETETNGDGTPVSQETGEGVEVKRSLYAVNSYDKTIIKDVTNEGGVYMIPKIAAVSQTEAETTAEAET